MTNKTPVPSMMQTEGMLADGGIMQEGGTVDPVSGNDVPAGSLKEEVRDDIDAKLSVGEFVIPADVVRYIGLEKLMKIRDAAKEGLKRMEEVGQMGNAEEAPKANEAFEEEDDNEFNSSIDEIMSEVDNEEQMPKMAAGGFMSGRYTEGMKFNPAVDVRYFKHPDGRVIYVTYINDKPMTAIPEGFTQTDKPVEQKVGKEAEDAAAAAARARTATTAGGDGGIDQPVDARTAAFFDNETKEQRDDRMGKVNSFLQQAVGLVVPGMGIINAVPGVLSSSVVGAVANAFGSRQDPNLVQVEDAGTYKGITAEYQTAVAAAEQKADNLVAGLAAARDAEETAQSNAQRNSEVTVGGPTSDQTVTGTDLGAVGDTTGETGGYTGSETQSSGEAYSNHKGGFITKKTKPAAKSKKGLASR